MRHTWAILLACNIAWPLAAPAQRTSPQITEGDLRSRLVRIADDSMMGRESGSLGDFKTQTYIASEFQRIALTPAGENGWFQTVPFWVVSGTAHVITLRDGTTLHAGTDFIVLPRAVDARLDGAIPVYGGRLDDSTTWIDTSAAANRMVVIDGSDQVTALELRRRLNAVFLSHRFNGARAVAIAQLDAIPANTAADLARPRVSNDSARIHRGVPLLITRRAADLLLAPAHRQPGVAAIAIHADGGEGVEPTPYPARNVIGVLPGSDPALRGEYVSLSAHNDHVGVCQSAVDHDSLRAYNRVVRPMGVDTPDRAPTAEEIVTIDHLRDSLRQLRPARADSICNGADDDGSGTVALLELAEWFASRPQAERPRRSLLFVSHTGEERGLVGSAWFTDHATVPVDSIVAEIDEDMVGRGTVNDLPKGGPTYLEVVGSRRLSNEFGDLLQAANARQPVPFVFNYEFDAPGNPLHYYCRADHYNYARYGVPSVALSRGEHLDYHQVTDEAQYIDYTDLRRVVLLVRDAATLIANLDHRPRLDHPRGDPHARCVQ